MHSCPPAVLLYVSLTACVELFGSLVCFLSATIQRPHHGWILGVETEPPDRWKSVTMMVSFYSSFIKSKRSSTLLCSGSGTAGDARSLRSEAPLVYLVMLLLISGAVFSTFIWF